MLCKAHRPISVTVQDSYISGPFKNRMSSSSGGYFHPPCHVTEPVLASTVIIADKLAEFFGEKVEGSRAATSSVLPP